MTRAGDARGSQLVALDDGAGVTAVLSPRAASVRALEVGGVAIVEPTAHRLRPPGMSGAVLVPWPNRVEDAWWTHEGRVERLAVTEPELGHALHGLLADEDYRVERIGGGSVSFGARVREPAGYPFRLDVRVAYRLVAEGLAARIEVENRGSAAAPVAIGAHPYLRIGDVPSSELRVSIDADHEWELDDRHIPRTRRTAARVAPRSAWPANAIGHALFERDAGARGEVVHTLGAPDGRRVELRADAALRWTQWYVDRALDTARGKRYAVALEPMSAPPNALRTGLGIRWIAPAECVDWNWSIRLRGAPDPGEAA